MANVLVNENSLSAIADAIRAKAGSEDTYKPAEMAQAILDLPSGGGGEVERKDVNFFDCDGKRLYSYTLDELQELDALPPLPDSPADNPNIVAVEWNWTLAGLKAHNGRMNVGAFCLTRDGKTHVHIVTHKTITVTMSINCYPGGCTIDWGDGNTDTIAESATASATHEYAPGDYDMAVSGQRFALRTSGGSNAFGLTNNVVIREINLAENHCIRSLALNSKLTRVTGIDINAYSLYTSYATVNISSAVNLRALIFRRKMGDNTIALPAVDSCGALKLYSIPEGVHTMAAYVRYTDIRELYVPTVTGTGSSAFTPAVKGTTSSSAKNSGLEDLFTKLPIPSSGYESTTLRRVVTADGCTSIGASAFYRCNSLDYVDIASTVTEIQGLDSTKAEIRFRGDTPPTVNSSSALGDPVKIIVPKGKGAIYRGESNYAQFADIIEEAEE